jgi:predicted transcriptional regulator
MEAIMVKKEAVKIKTVKINHELHKQLKKIAVEWEKDLTVIIEAALLDWVKQVNLGSAHNPKNENGQAVA